MSRATILGVLGQRRLCTSDHKAMEFGVDGSQGETQGPPLPEDLAHIRLAQSGNREAFARLYERYAPVVHGIVFAHAPARDVPDLVQDVFLSALSELPALEDPARFAGWLAAIARHRAQDAWRRWRRSAQALAPGAPGASDEDRSRAMVEHAAPASGPSLADRELAQRALAALGSLPPAYRETLVLRLVEGLDGSEISARTGLTPGSVRVNLCRGMKLLRERLQATGAAP